MRCPWPIGERVFLTLEDGTTLTYDVYQPLDNTFEGKKEMFNIAGVIGYVANLN